ncbi:MAG: hypothetical protein ABIB11_01960 [Candidatus Omnitrophota bacterium]
MIFIIFFAIFLTIWWYVGYKAFIRTYTKMDDFKVSDVPLAALAGLVLGPILCAFCYFYGNKKVVVPKQKP